ncbi:M24 family metallopeptidase [Patulibacter sp. NPDC049589]|uniref:M24 family metallopeptidase n=1 Tax=Patulibacter sp. NPDC049589 TaxID=3154731 RepID=UPI003438A27B
MDPARARATLGRRRLDALLAVTPEDVQHLTGHRPYAAGLGQAVAVLAADGASRALVVGAWDHGRARTESDVAVVLASPVWIEVDELDDLRAGTTTVRPKPAQHDEAAAAVLVRDALEASGVDVGAPLRIGVATHALALADAEALRAVLPRAELVDAVAAFHDLRAIKHPVEVARLRHAAALADDALRATLAAGVEGRSPLRLRAAFAAAAWSAASHGDAAVTEVRGDFTTGGEVAPSRRADTTPIAPGDVLFADFGVEVDGYGSDAGRSFAVGRVPALSARIFDALLAGHAAAVPLIRPGTPMREVFRVAQDAVRRGGLPTYTRGHVGHAAGLGLDEQGPFLGPFEERPLEPGMVVCFETPYYVRGLGGHQLEDMYLITDDGAERLTHHPAALVAL